MCDKCPCTTFAPHLWKAGECRDCHHSISEHILVPSETQTAVPQPQTPPQQKHSYVGKLSVDKLEPFSHALEENALATSSGGNIIRVRSSVNLSLPQQQQHEQSGTRLSVNHGTRLQTNEERRDSEGGLKPSSRNMLRRSSSFKAPGEVDQQTTYEDRLAASFRKSREIYAKRKSSSDVGADAMKEQHRNMIIEELVVTERDYCRDMEYLTQMIMEPLATKSLLDRNDIAGIFSNIQEIRAVNNALLQQLEQSANLSAQTVGDIFSKMSAFFKCYSKYCTNHVNSLNILQDRKKERPELALYLKTLKFDSNAGKLGVEDYLIKPIQRICKYPLFFHQLLEYTAQGSKEYTSLTEANTQMQKVAAHVNDFHRQAENMNRVLEIQQRVHGTPISLVSSSRRFIFEQLATVKTLEEPSWNTRCIFLFSDLLLYSRPPSKFSKKYTYVGSVNLEIVSLSVSDTELSLVKADGTPSLQLSCADIDKNHWVSILRLAIEDTSSKRMSLQQALKDTANGQHEDPRELKRRSSYRNSVINLNTDEILNKRGTLRHIDSSIYNKLSQMNFGSDNSCSTSLVPPPAFAERRSPRGPRPDFYGTQKPKEPTAVKPKAAAPQKLKVAPQKLKEPAPQKPKEAVPQNLPEQPEPQQLREPAPQNKPHEPVPQIHYEPAPPKIFEQAPQQVRHEPVPYTPREVAIPQPTLRKAAISTLPPPPMPSFTPLPSFTDFPTPCPNTHLSAPPFVPPTITIDDEPITPTKRPFSTPTTSPTSTSTPTTPTMPITPTGTTNRPPPPPRRTRPPLESTHDQQGQQFPQPPPPLQQTQPQLRQLPDIPIKTGGHHGAPQQQRASRHSNVGVGNF